MMNFLKNDCALIILGGEMGTQNEKLLDELSFC